MTLNHKQKELVDKMLAKVTKKFPNVKYLDIGEGLEDPGEIWIYVSKPEDDDRYNDLIEYSASLAMNVLMKYGYSIYITPRSEKWARLLTA